MHWGEATREEGVRQSYFGCFFSCPLPGFAVGVRFCFLEILPTVYLIVSLLCFSPPGLKEKSKVLVLITFALF